MKLSKAQHSALRMIEKRDWPAGEPRRSWFHGKTLAVLMRLALVEERFHDALYLTPAGRAALEGARSETHTPSN